MEKNEREVLNLEEKKPNERGGGTAWNAMQYLETEGGTVVYRFQSYADTSLRTGRRPGLDFRCWYNVFGWKASEPYRTAAGESAIKVRTLTRLERVRVETTVRQADKLLPTDNVSFFDWSLVR